ncbi:MAG: NUDIX hydrolase [Candidatus Ornithomonoglobus sp.]
MDTELFEVLSSNTIKISRFEITEDKLKTADQQFYYSFIKIKPGICAIIETEKGFVVLKEYRYPIKSWTYEFAAGIIDEGETPSEAAIREIKEETGFIADEIKELGIFYPSFGATDEMIYLFHAKCSSKADAETEFSEFIKYELMSEQEVEQLIRSGEFKHGAGLSAWLKYMLNRE